MDDIRTRSSRKRQKKTKLDSVSHLKAKLEDAGWQPGLSEGSYVTIAEAGFRGKNLLLACVAAEIALTEQPITLRGLFYRVVSAGILPSTDKPHYNRLMRVLSRLREYGAVPFCWIVDNLRETYKPPSWSGLADFAETVRTAYRRDFWSGLPDYVHVFVEKDALSGVCAPVTQEYDVSLSVIRGYSSLSFAYGIAEQWNQIKKPIHVYFVGDFDPSGFDLERDIRDKLTKYCNRSFYWTRLGVNAEDFEAFDLIPLDPKKSDRRYQQFVAKHGEQCAELDALPPTELRRRIRDAIESHIPQGEWRRLKEIEAVEKETFTAFLEKMPGGAA